MVYYDRIDVFEVANVNETSESKECSICHYWYFLIKGFKFQPNVCNGYYDTLMSMNLNDIAVLNVHGIDYCCIINGISKSGAMGLLRNSSLIRKEEHYNR